MHYLINYQKGLKLKEGWKKKRKHSFIARVWKYRIEENTKICHTKALNKILKVRSGMVRNRRGLSGKCNVSDNDQFHQNFTGSLQSVHCRSNSSWSRWNHRSHHFYCCIHSSLKYVMQIFYIRDFLENFHNKFRGQLKIELI